MKKKFLSICMVAIIGCLTAISAFAAENDIITYTTENGGGGFAIITENDNIQTRATKSKTIYDGSERALYWIYGNRSGSLISEAKGYDPYYGRASVTNGNGDYEDGGWQPANS